MPDTDKIRITIPVIVEGKYDKARLSSIIDGVIITTDGFGVFKNEEKRALIRQLGKDGVIILCDSDGGGALIRSHLKGMMGGIKVYNLYTPQIEGKEKRKSQPSKAGYLGVEGIDSSVLRDIFRKFVDLHPELTGGEQKEISDIPRSLMFELGLTGSADSSAKRDMLCDKLGLPRGMNANALHSALSMLVTTEELKDLCESLSE